MEQEEIFNREVKSLQRLLDDGNVEEIRKLRQTRSLVDILTSSSSNFIASVSSFLNDKHLYRCPRIVESYEELFQIIINETDPLDTFITFMEQLDEDTCFLEKFILLLKPLKLALLKLAESRKSYLEWTFSVIQSFLSNLSPPEDHEIEFDEKKMLTNDPYIVSILFLMDSLMNFYDSFIENTISKREIDVLIIFAFHLLAEPAMFVYLEKFQEVDEKCQRIVAYIDHFTYNVHYFLASLNERNMTYVMYDEKRSLMEIDEVDAEGNLNLEDRISPQHLALYYFVKLNDQPMNAFPCVYSKFYLFHKLLFLCNSLTQHSHNAVTRKGLLMGERLLNWIEDGSIPRYFLELKVHVEFVRIVTKVSVFSYIFENRRTAAKLLLMYIHKFDVEGTYALYLNIWRATCNSDIDGEIITSFRRKMYTNFIEDKFEYYQKGKLLIDLLKVFGHLEKGADTNLMECKNKVISFLHLLALIIRRDRANVTTIHDHFEYFENNYFKVIKMATKKCRETYKQEANALMNDEGDHDLKTADKLNFVVDGRSLPRLKKEEKIMATKNALNALNIIENALTLVYDYANRDSQHFP